MAIPKIIKAKYKLSLTIFFLFLVITNISWQVYSQRNLLSPSAFNPNTLSKIYKYSQFAPKPADRKVIIEDNDLFAYSGYLYVRGVKPSEIQIEHPPLVKYFYGLSILIFKNPSVIQLVFGINLLLLVYIISNLIFKNSYLSLIPVLLLSLDGTFKKQFILTYLDLPHVLFICASVFFYLKASSNRKYYLLTSLFLGATILSKYMGFVIIPILIGYTSFKRKIDFNYFAKTLILVPLIYLANYITLFDRNFISNFYHLHLDIFHLYRSYLPDYPWGEIWRLLITGQWRVWFGNTQFIPIDEWSLFWPLTFIGMLVSLFLVFGKKSKDEPLILITIFAFLYLVTNSFHVVFPRHLLVYLIFGYILLVFAIKIVIEKLVFKKLR